MHAVEPFKTENVPGAQTTQVLAFHDFVAFENVPDMHKEHTDVPFDSAYEPGAQGVHTPEF